MKTIFSILSLLSVVSALDRFGDVNYHERDDVQPYQQPQARETLPETIGGFKLERRASKPVYTVGGFAYGKTKIRGVNLGGWLVLEPWITPSIFEATNDTSIIDEYTYGAKYGSVEASRRLKNHWDTWITERDFKSIASYKLNHVRLPVGHWAWDIQGKEQYAQGQIPYLLKAVEWARKYNIKVMVDLHGAPESQNGYDNSGKQGKPNWQNVPGAVERTEAVIAKIATLFANDTDTVTSIAVLNEPRAINNDKILQTAIRYYNEVYPIIRSKGNNALVTYHYAYQKPSVWKDFQTNSTYNHSVALDLHYYSVFSTAGLKANLSARLEMACAKARDVAQYQQIVLVGEFSPAPTDCAKWLNGRNEGARYEALKLGKCNTKTGKTANFSQEYKDELRAHWEGQVGAWEKNGNGWIQWCWKTEQAAEWSYHSGVTGGWIPKNPTERKYPDPCQ